MGGTLGGVKWAEKSNGATPSLVRALDREIQGTPKLKASWDKLSGTPVQNGIPNIDPPRLLYRAKLKETKEGAREPRDSHIAFMQRVRDNCAGALEKPEFFLRTKPAKGGSSIS